MSGIIEIDDRTFEREVLESPVPVLLDFSAEWCAPCKRLEPVVREIASEYDGRLKVARLDIDRAQEIATRYGIMSVPTVLFFKEGRVHDQHLGFAPKEKLVEKIASLL
jgi:thioredoxin 1